MFSNLIGRTDWRFKAKRLVELLRLEWIIQILMVQRQEWCQTVFTDVMLVFLCRPGWLGNDRKVLGCDVLENVSNTDLQT